MSTLYFILMVAGLVNAVNAVRPPLVDRVAAMRPPWLPAMITSEFAPLWVLVVASLTGLAWAVGATSEPLGQLGLLMACVTVGVLLVLIGRSFGAAASMRSALHDVVDVGDVSFHVGRILLPDPYRIPDDVEVREGEAYRAGNVADLYWSATALRTPAPVLLQIHGGSWSGGNRKQQARPLIHEMARRGWLVASIDYPLVPEVSLPDQLAALHEAVAWLRSGVHGHDVDAGQVYVTGGSAGGHLAALVALTAGSSLDGEGARIPIGGAVTMYGIYDLLNRNDTHDDWPIIPTKLVQADPVEDPDRFRAGSPIDHVAPDSPPFLVVHGTHDSLVPLAESQQFVEALRLVSENPVVFAEIPGATHAFDVVPSIRTQSVVAAVASFLDEMVRPPTASSGPR